MRRNKSIKSAAGFLLVIAVCGICKTHAQLQPWRCGWRVIDVEEECRQAIAIWRGSLPHWKVFIKQKGPPLNVEVAPGVILLLRDDWGDGAAQMTFNVSHGPTIKAERALEEARERQRYEEWLNTKME
jgi:hypothetical protein